MSAIFCSVRQIAIKATVIKRPSSALTEGALDAHGENTEMSLEEKMKKIMEMKPGLKDYSRINYRLIQDW